MIDYREYYNSGTLAVPTSGVTTWLGSSTFVGLAVSAGDRILVNGSATTMGNVSGGEVWAGVYACYRNSGGTITTGSYNFDHYTATTTSMPREVHAVSDIFTGLSGTYEFGLCGRWNSGTSTDFIYRDWTVLVFQ